MSERTCAEKGCERPLNPQEKKYCPHHAERRARGRRKAAGIATSILGAVIVVAKVIITRRA